jgi:hypothetical protein
MTRVVLAASQSASSVAVIDFTTPSAPKEVLVSPKFEEAGCTVDLSGVRGVIGSYLGSTAKMRTINVSNPASPELGLPIPIELAGIGAVAIDPTGTHVAVGERSGSRVVLLDIQTGTPAITATVAVNKIAAVAFCGPKLVAASGQESQAALIDFSVSPPHISYIKPGMGGNLTVACDEGLVAVGDHENAVVKLYETSNPATPKAETPNGPAGTFSIGLSGESALCGTTNGDDAVLIDFANGTTEKFVAKVGSGVTVNSDGPDGICGGVHAGAIALFDLAVRPPKLLGVLEKSGVSSIQSIAVAAF